MKALFDQYIEKENLNLFLNKSNFKVLIILSLLYIYVYYS